MIRSAFRMKLKPGTVEEYKKRHDEIWPELSKVHLLPEFLIIQFILMRKHCVCLHFAN